MDKHILSKEAIIQALNIDSVFEIVDFKPLFKYETDKDGDLVQTFTSIELTIK